MSSPPRCLCHCLCCYKISLFVLFRCVAPSSALAPIVWLFFCALTISVIVSMLKGTIGCLEIPVTFSELERRSRIQYFHVNTCETPQLIVHDITECLCLLCQRYYAVLKMSCWRLSMQCHRSNNAKCNDLLLEPMFELSNLCYRIKKNAISNQPTIENFMGIPTQPVAPFWVLTVTRTYRIGLCEHDIST